MAKKIFHWNAHNPRAFAGRAAKQPTELLDEIIAYLRAGKVSDPLPQTASCRICGMHLGDTLRTDGEYCWPDQTEHYIIAHHVWTPEHKELARRVVYGGSKSMPRPEETDYDSEEVMLDEDDFDMSWLFEGDQVGDPLQGNSQPLSDNDFDIPGVFDDLQFNAPLRASPQSLSDNAFGTPEARDDFRSTLRSSPRSTPRSEGNSAMIPPDYTHDPSARPSFPTYGSGSPGSPRQLTYGASDYELGTQIAAAYPQAGVALANKIVEVARHVGAHPFDLANMIAYETAYFFRPDIQYDGNPGEPFTEYWYNPETGRDVGRATGLIQFTPPTARKLDTTTYALFQMSADQQMEYVRAYLDMERQGRPLDTPHKVAMAIFEPKAIDWPPDKLFDPAVPADNRGIQTPREYLQEQLGSRKINLPSSTGEAPPVDPRRGPMGPEEPGMMSQLQQWLGSWFEPSAPQAPTAFQAPQAPATPYVPVKTASWSVEPGLRLRLVGAGRNFDPGTVPAGSYQIQHFDGITWVTMGGATELLPQVSYRAYAVEGRLKWARA